MIAAALFVEGGDQTNYIETWTGTLLHAAMQSHVDVHPIGGTSAGMHIMGGVIYAPPQQHGGIGSDEALSNPNSPRMAFAGNFYGIGLLSGVVTDTHFRERDRMGRTLAFLAQSSANKAIMADEGTALLIEVKDGDPHKNHGRVVGGGAVYFARNENAPSVAAPNKLSLGPTQIQRVKRGAGAWDQYFNFATWAHSGGIVYSLAVDNGQIVATYPGGNTSATNYYGDGYSNL